MKLVWFIGLLGLFHLPAQAEELLNLIPEAIAKINRTHAQLFQNPDTCASADALVKKARWLEDYILNVTMGIIAVKKMEYYDDLSQKHFETQKALMAFRLLQVYERNKYNKKVIKPLYSIGTMCADTFGFSYLGLALYKYHQVDGYKTSLFSAAFGMGAFFASCYCRHQARKLVELPIPTKKQIYESEKKDKGLNAVEGGMKPIKLGADNKFARVQLPEELATTIFGIVTCLTIKMREKYQADRVKSLIKLRSMAFNEHDVEAILALTDLIEAD